MEFKDKKTFTKRKAPITVRQTLTSAYRILKANPLMMHDTESVKKMGIQDTTKIPKTVDILGISSKNNNVTLASQSIIHSNVADQHINADGNKSEVNKPKSKIGSSVLKKPQDLSIARKLLQSNRKTIHDSKPFQLNNCKSTAKEPVRQSISTMYRERTKCRRRSKSAESFNPSKCIKKYTHEEINIKLQTSYSLNELSKHLQSENNAENSCQNENGLIESSNKSLPPTQIPVKKTVTVTNGHQKRRSKSFESFSQNSPQKDISKRLAEALPVANSLSDLQEESNLDVSVSPIKKNRPVFKTPIAYNRRSVVQRTPSTDRKSIYKLHSSTPTPVDLQRRLNDWLVKRGKSLSSFHHLKCFGLHNTNEQKEILQEDEENKENLQKQITPITESIEDEDQKSKRLEEKHNTINVNYVALARDALDDLHKLIQDGYPLDQCDGWLGRIRQKYLKLEEEPLYWECRAALEQCKGNISSAIEHYRKAIVNGAEVQVIEGSLDQLLQKFSLLNIDPDITKENTKAKRVILDAQNAFKTTIIQFAVQERMLKKKEEDAQRKLIVTPVRRSTRLSMKHNGSSHIKLCSSIKDIEMDENTEFHKNSYLSIRFTP